MEAMFKAYFIEGRDIGDHAVLADCAIEAGLDPADVGEFLTGDLADSEMGQRIRPRARQVLTACRRSSSTATDCSPAPCRRKRFQRATAWP